MSVVSGQGVRSLRRGRTGTEVEHEQAWVIFLTTQGVFEDRSWMDCQLFPIKVSTVPEIGRDDFYGSQDEPFLHYNYILWQLRNYLHAT
ncbi:MAG: hypothetical protein HQK55_07310 [Deltaproteobacteria bacterium]|nr:hypothetical protein [Deltaproteobacteria bacterium]